MAASADIIGFVGVFCFLLAYFLLQRGTLPHTGLGYLGLNLAGSLLVIVSLLVNWNTPAFLLEAAWALISMAGIVNYYRRKHRDPPH